MTHIADPASIPPSQSFGRSALRPVSSPGLGRAPDLALVLGVPVVDAAPAAAIKALLAPGRRRAFFLNAHCCNVMARDRAYAAALGRADMVLPDGIGVELAARMTGRRLTANLNGTDFTPELMKTAARRGLSVFLFGGRPGVAERAAATLCLQAPGLRVVGMRDGYKGASGAEAAINASGADIVLVALGVPMQELWLDRHANRLSARVTLGVGALFDFLAGEVRRAPAPVRRARLEWAWRLAQEPRRMAGRYLAGNAVFMVRAAWHAAKQWGKQDAAQGTAQAAGQGAGQGAGKRALDIAVAGAALAVAAPAMAVFALAIKLDSPGPAFFTQTRVGKDGREFKVWKFRTMHRDAESRRAALLAQSDREGVCFKARHDPRVTRIGRLLRRSSLDELPQIFNVLVGHMSIVGPRPALPEETAIYPVRALGRLAVKPGITGLWQVSGRADIGFDKMIDMDLSYARSRSMLLDLLLIGMTFRAVLTGRGAY
jgi:exopolysaccharide biosynthesis WecB/TagA/CpsF family protein